MGSMHVTGTSTFRQMASWNVLVNLMFSIPKLKQYPSTTLAKNPNGSQFRILEDLVFEMESMDEGLQVFVKTFREIS